MAGPSVCPRRLSAKVSLYGQPFYTLFRLEKQWARCLGPSTLFRTLPEGGHAYGRHRTHRLSPFLPRPYGQRTPDAVCADRRGTRLYRGAYARPGPSLDALGPAEVSSTSGLSSRLGRCARADSHLSLPATPSAAGDVYAD